MYDLVLPITYRHLRFSPAFFNFKMVFFNNNLNQRDYYTIAQYIHQTPQPKIINAGAGESGFGILDNVLPAGKYWSQQYDATEEMRESHRALILSGTADYIIVRWYHSLEKRTGLTIGDIEQVGYHIVCYFEEEDASVLLSKKEIARLPLITPSKHDLFFKKNWLSFE